jgi:predicted metal-dependent hydrolase
MPVRWMGVLQYSTSIYSSRTQEIHISHPHAKSLGSYKIIRSRRKTFSLVIEMDGSLTVRAPLRASQAQIEHILAEKAAWIRSKQDWVHQNATPPHAYQTGEVFYFMGITYTLEITAARRPSLALEDGFFRLALPAQAQAAHVFERWYRQQAGKVIPERTATLAREYGYTFTRVRITGAAHRWGSCSSNGGLNFTWRLVMATPAAIDYVITHELVHLEVRNHSSRFWGRMHALLPEYAQQVAWLKNNGHLLRL